MSEKILQTDALVIGSGVAGLTFALKAAELGRVLILTKSEELATNSQMAQGGVAAVMSSEDSFSKHIQDTLNAGAGLCDEVVVAQVIEQAPQRIRELIQWGVPFDLHSPREFEDAVGTNQTGNTLDLTREGGHTQRRIVHVGDHTGNAIVQNLLDQAKKNPNIHFLPHHFAIDVITSRKVDPKSVGRNRCYGVYALAIKTGEVIRIAAKMTVLATGGAGKVYLYTSNWQGATGDGIAMAYRAGARVADLEFMQFHPTCLYHPRARNFLISEAVRGEGGEIVNDKGEAFMRQYHSLGSLAPRDIVARSIDAELKTSGAECVYLDLSKKSGAYWEKRFPSIFAKCLEFGVDIRKDLIPVVPAAHYLCGGVLSKLNGETDVERLFVIGETACTGLHGANRLASNSLLECLVMGHMAANFFAETVEKTSVKQIDLPEWINTSTDNPDEMIVVHHLWDEIRRLMWNYVGIVRTDKRLRRAQTRLNQLQSEIKEYYQDFKLHPDLLELRNLALVAELTVTCALNRRVSVGIHYNLDCETSKS